jgi:hypothetical protein
MLFLVGKLTVAQVPVASGPAAKEEQTSGMTLNTSFNGSVASGGDVYDWTTTTGYIFNKHFSADVGVPILVVRGTTSTGATTSNSVGRFGTVWRYGPYPLIAIRQNRSAN